MTLDLKDPAIKRAINNLEALKDIAPINRIHILLVADGTKPSMHDGINSELYESGSEKKHVDEELYAKLVEITHNLGLKILPTTNIESRNTYDRIEYFERKKYFIAKTSALAQDLLSAYEARNEINEGLLLGFPQSSVEAYVKKEVVRISDLPNKTDEVDKHQMKFLNHMLSRNYWREEVKYLPYYAKRTEILSKSLYDTYIGAN